MRMIVSREGADDVVATSKATCSTEVVGGLKPRHCVASILTMVIGRKVICKKLPHSVQLPSNFDIIVRKEKRRLADTLLDTWRLDTHTVWMDDKLCHLKFVAGNGSGEERPMRAHSDPRAHRWQEQRSGRRLGTDLERPSSLMDKGRDGGI